MLLVWAGLALLAILILPFVFLRPDHALLLLLVLFLALGVAARWLVPWLMRFAVGRVLMAPFKARSAILKNARVDVHAITRQPPPEHPELDIEAIDHDRDPSTAAIDVLTPYDYFAIEMTITPAARPAASTNMAANIWEPGELRLAPPGPAAHQPPVAGTDAAAPAEWAPRQVQRIEQGNVVEDPVRQCIGAARLRLLIALPREAPRRLTLRYYFETLTELALP
jgi:hypothetical protein